MRIAVVAVLAMVGVIVFFALSDALRSSLLSGLGALLLVIPISLGLFALLVHRADERQR